MSRRKKHTPIDVNNIRDDLFKMFSPPFSKSKEKVWEDLSKKLQYKRQNIQPTKVLRLNIYRNIAAAAIVIILTTVCVMRFYPTKICTLHGEHLKVNLPDSSIIYLNAGSEITYFPLWWNLSRKVILNGEAFFMVTSGNKFEIKTENGKVSVLGTSFNVYDRDDIFRVDCSTGKVQVYFAPEKEKMILESGQSVNNNKGHLKLSIAANINSIGAWRKNKLIFTNEPLEMVFKEIERQYTVTIDIPQTLPYYFTGSFFRENDIEWVLYFVCKPFNLKFKKISDKKFKIVSD